MYYRQAMLSVIISSVLIFLSTEVDDFAIYVILFAQKKDKRFPIFLGQLMSILVVSAFFLCFNASGVLFR